MKSFRTQATVAGLAIGALLGGCQSPTTQASLASGPEALDRVEAILSTAAPESLARVSRAPLASSSIEFTRAEGTEAPERLEMLPDPEDPNNGVDDDGDGLVDEVRLVWTSSKGSTEVLCSNVLPLGADEELNGMDDNGNGLIDEGGVTFHRRRGQVAVSITVSITVPGPDATPTTLWRYVATAGD